MIFRYYSTNGDVHLDDFKVGNVQHLPTKIFNYAAPYEKEEWGARGVILYGYADFAEPIPEGFIHKCGDKYNLGLFVIMEESDRPKSDESKKEEKKQWKR